MKSVVSEKGQVTIPKALRDRLDIKSGEVLDFQEDNGRLVATKATVVDPVDELFGVVTVPGGTDKFLEQL